MRIAALAGFLLAAALAAGCGGGDRLSQNELRQRAGAICDKYEAQVRALDRPSSVRDIPEYVDKVLPLLQKGIAELRELDPPEELADDYDRMLDENEKAIPAARELADAAENNDVAAVQKALREGERANDASDRIARRLGLTGCVSE